MTYKPISCSVFDVLEASAMKHVTLRLGIENGHERVQRDVKVLDLFSKEKVEYMLAKAIDTGQEITLRLDNIVYITDLTSNTTYFPRQC
jgi:transcriptional antiterminator Rof (Rho-off)